MTRRLAVCALLLATSVAAQDGPVQVEVRVRVTAASGRDVFIDQGREAGLEPGDELALFPAGGGRVLARVSTVSRSNARAELAGAVQAIPPGTEGTVQVPKARLVKPDSETPQEQPAVPEHPPWQTTFGADDPDKPLLAPVTSRTPSERPTRLHGRSWLNVNNSWNRQPVDQRYFLGNSGADLLVTNPFGEGGEVLLRGDLSYREVDVDGAPDDDTGKARLDRFSYRYGHADDGRHRVQVGRFLQTMFPELGLVDGIEADTRLGARQRVGLSFGGYPEPFPSRATGDSLQAALFWRFCTEDDTFDAGAAYQKTWFEGSPDRDLVVVNSSAQPTADLRLYGSLWLDYYTGSEAAAPSGLEVTEVLLNGSYRLNPQNGVGLSLSHIRWPDLLRNEFGQVSAAQILDDRVFRVTGSTWHDLTDRLRLSLLAAYWEDQDDDGISGDVGVGFRDLFLANSSLDVHVFRNAGSYQDGSGARATFSRSAQRWSWHLGYEISSYDSASQTIAGDEFDLLQAALAGAQVMISSSTDLSFNLDYRFGDDQDALTVGAFLQTRF